MPTFVRHAATTVNRDLAAHERLLSAAGRGTAARLTLVAGRTLEEWRPVPFPAVVGR